jgi:hypothetical protein
VEAKSKMDAIDLQNKFAVCIANSVKAPWDEIRIHYENAEIEGVAREIFSAYMIIEGTKREVEPPLEALDILIEMQQHKPQDQLESWLWVEFLMDKTGKYRFDYKYDTPPLIMDQIKYSG